MKSISANKMCFSVCIRFIGVYRRFDPGQWSDSCFQNFAQSITVQHPQSTNDVLRHHTIRKGGQPLCKSKSETTISPLSSTVFISFI